MTSALLTIWAERAPCGLPVVVASASLLAFSAATLAAFGLAPTIVAFAPFVAFVTLGAANGALRGRLTG